MKILAVGAMPKDRQADMMTLTVAFSNSADALRLWWFVIQT